MMDAHLLAVDPGLMTGIATWAPEQAAPFAFELSLEQMYEFVRDTLVHGTTTYDIVCEAYTISERTLKSSRQAWSLELIGLLKWAAWNRGHSFKLQQASSAKRFADNARLKSVGWHVPGRDHANDALRHLYLHAVQCKIITL